MLKVIIKTLSIILSIAVLIFIAFMLIIKVPIVKSNYYKRIHTSSLIEKKYTALGNYDTDYIDYKSDDIAIKKYEIWYPKDIERDNKIYPIVIMSNGTSVVASRYKAVFKHLASWGFIVIGNECNNSWSGEQTSKTLDFILALNEDKDSIFYEKIDKENIGAAGHSQGGVGTINAVTTQENGYLYKAIYTASCVQNMEIDGVYLYDVSKINIPYFMVASDGKSDTNIAPLSSLQANFNNLPQGVPAILARRKNSEHAIMLSNADGYMTAWFRYMLMDDKEASKAFVGDDAEIFSNIDNWQDVKVKNFDK